MFFLQFCICFLLLFYCGSRQLGTVREWRLRFLFPFRTVSYSTLSTSDIKCIILIVFFPVFPPWPWGLTLVQPLSGTHHWNAFQEHPFSTVVLEFVEFCWHLKPLFEYSLDKWDIVRPWLSWAQKYMNWRQRCCITIKKKVFFSGGNKGLFHSLVKQPSCWRQSNPCTSCPGHLEL